ncbi:MAG: anion transporter [Acidobacteria bacterium]|nr:anion transporter [Acidobacteriota bacterium]
MFDHWPASHLVTLGVFVVVYVGMLLGGLPRLRLDRTGVALLGAIAMVGTSVVTTREAAASVHLPTVLLLFSFMVISAQMRLGGFYSAVTVRITTRPLSPRKFLGVIVAVSAALSAVFSNDIVCLAVAPLLTDACLRRRLDPVPYLLALACASNIGSAATLIGNPQNMLIGEVLQLDFAGYAAGVLPPVVLALIALWGQMVWQLTPGGVVTLTASQHDALLVVPPAFDRWQTIKGLAVAGALMAIFLYSSWPRDVSALVGAGLLMLSQRFHSSKIIGLIDWPLLILFVGLFVVNHAMEATELAPQALAWLAGHGVALDDPLNMFGATLVLSNLVSNVPAVMLLLPAARAAGDAVLAGTTLALVSTLAGNLLIVGSIANIIVVDAAARHGIAIDWRRHARTGVPATLISLAIAALWLRLRAVL